MVFLCFTCVAENQGIEGNKKADKYAVSGSSSDETMPWNAILTPLIVIRQIKKKTY